MARVWVVRGRAPRERHHAGGVGRAPWAFAFVNGRLLVEIGEHLLRRRVEPLFGGGDGELRAIVLGAVAGVVGCNYPARALALSRNMRPASVSFTPRPDGSKRSTPISSLADQSVGACGEP